MRQPFRYVEQVAGDEDPVRLEVSDCGDDGIVPWLIAVEMEVAQMNSSSAGQRAVRIGESRDFVRGESDFHAGNETEESIDGFAQAMSDERTGAIGPGRCASCHPITRSSSTRSEGVTR